MKWYDTTAAAIITDGISTSATHQVPARNSLLSFGLSHCFCPAGRLLPVSALLRVPIFKWSLVSRFFKISFPISSSPSALFRPVRNASSILRLRSGELSSAPFSSLALWRNGPAVGMFFNKNELSPGSDRALHLLRLIYSNLLIAARLAAELKGHAVSRRHRRQRRRRHLSWTEVWCRNGGSDGQQEKKRKKVYHNLTFNLDVRHPAEFHLCTPLVVGIVVVVVENVALRGQVGATGMRTALLR